MSVTEVKVPDIGDFKDVPVIEIMVKAGDQVKAEDSLVSLESDKATMDVPSPGGGTVKELKVKVGDKVSEGSVILLLDGGGGGTRRSAEARGSPPPSPTSAPGGVAEVRVPDIGDFKDVPVIEIMVKPGDTVKAEDPLVTLESDKATMDVPAPLGGTVQEVKVKVGDKVSEGTCDPDAADQQRVCDRASSGRSRDGEERSSGEQPLGAGRDATNGCTGCRR